MYRYRGLTPEEKTEILHQRRLNNFPPHAPPHLHDTEGWFLITATTYEHKRHFHTDEERIWILSELQKELQVANITISGWVVLPNHYHLLVKCQPLSVISQPLRRVHARTALELNRREGLTERQIWYRFSDRQIRSDRHYYTTLNYIHYNPTKHDYDSAGFYHNRYDIFCLKIETSPQGHSIVPIHFIYMDTSSSVGASCARDLS